MFLLCVFYIVILVTELRARIGGSVSVDANNELNVSMNDDNENVEEPNTNDDNYNQCGDLEEGNNSSVIDDALLEQIANELGGLPNANILSRSSEAITT